MSTVPLNKRLGRSFGGRELSSVTAQRIVEFFKGVAGGWLAYVSCCLIWLIELLGGMFTLGRSLDGKVFALRSVLRDFL